MSTVTLKIREDAGYDVATLTELLTNVDPSASINGDSIVVDAAQEQAVRAILAEVGIEVLEGNAVTAAVTSQQPGTQPELLEAAALKLSAGYSLHLTASDSSAVWNVIDAKGTPIAAVSLADQEDSETLAQVFATEAYGTQLQAAFEQLGTKETLSRTKARLYASHQVKAPEQVNIKAYVEQNSIKAEHCLDLALKAAHKNVIADPLKQHVLASLMAQNVPNAPEIVASMFDVFPQFMATIRAQATKYMGMEPAALQATEDMLNDMDCRDLKPQDSSPANDQPLSASALAQRARLNKGNTTQQTLAASILAAPEAKNEDLDTNNLRASVADAFGRF